MGIEAAFKDSFIVTKLSEAVGLARSNSLWPMPFATSCCGIEFMAVMGSDRDIARFGAERPSFSPRQADLLIVLGTITNKMAPVLKRIYDQMCEPKWVFSHGACASSGGIYNTYSVVQGIDELFPVDMYLAGCPPRPEAYLHAFMEIQKMVRNESLMARRYELRKNYRKIKA
jgi:NADH-quinone oxidoreductase subunit B